MTPLIADFAWTAIGLALLLAGGWLLVRGASRLALTFGVSPLVVGATVVALGTSAPELVVSVVAGLEGSGALAVGNVLGSNITNVALVVGIASLIRPMTVHPGLLKWEMPVLAVATGAFIVAGLSGMIGHVVGAVLFGSLIAFVALSLLLHRERELPPHGQEFTRDRKRLSRWGSAREIVFVLAGLGGLALGSDTAVNGAVGIAERVGMSEVAIGLTIVAIGTSLPEVMTTVVAALQGEQDIAIANVVGSNIFNLLGVLGLTSALATVPISFELYSFEIPALAATTALLFLVAWTNRRVVRAEGIALLAVYIAFLGLVLARSGM